MDALVSGNENQPYDLGRDYSTGPEGVDRSLLAYCLTRLAGSRREDRDWALEFGTGTGLTAAMIAQYVPVLTFDAFKGLPEDWRPGFLKGRFAEWGLPPNIPGATIVPGWFEDTLPGYEWPERISLVHFDADLYTSTVTVLDAIGHLLVRGVICVFDEFHGFDDDFNGTMPGEQQAWREFAASTGIEWEVIGHGREQWAIQITDRP